MKKGVVAGAVGILLAMGSLAVVSTPAQAAGCGIYDAWDSSTRSATQMSYKGCNYYRAKIYVDVYGNPTWSPYGATVAPSPSQTHVWTYVYFSSATGVYGSANYFQYASSPWMYGGYIAH
ncbi:MAG: hypothetical protein JW722_07640 [Demequinaceae bacterium]|nr:hypothetical protein [Demequinaceae bacterium]